VPGDIKWLSKVGDAQMQLVGSDEFGQVSSGCLTMTGRLGVFRIDKEKSGNAGSNNEILVNIQRWVKVSWDTVEIEKVFGKPGDTVLWRCSQYGTAKGTKLKRDSLDVFYLPVRIMDTNRDTHGFEIQMLTGLPLLPTGKKYGQFRRVGQFETLYDWDTINYIGPFTNKSNVLDERFFMSKHKNGDFTVSIV
jgi:hypothetical protein